MDGCIEYLSAKVKVKCMKQPLVAGIVSNDIVGRKLKDAINDYG